MTKGWRLPWLAGIFVMHFAVAVPESTNIEFMPKFAFGRGIVPLRRRPHACMEEDVAAYEYRRYIDNSSFGEALNLAAIREPLQNKANTQYFAAVSIGEPAQTVELIFDTGSSDIWVKQSAFNLHDSKSLKDTGRATGVQYGQGFVMGNILRDTIRISELTLPATTFLILTSQSYAMSAVLSDGVAGLAFPVLSHTGDTLLHHLKENGVTSFTFMLTSTLTGSFIAFGGDDDLDPTWYVPGTLVWTRSVSLMWWAFEGGVDVGSFHYSAPVVLLDSGTSFLGVPSTRFEDFLDELLTPEGKQLCRQQPTMIYVCPCSVAKSMRTVNIIVDGQSFPMGPAEMLGVLAPSSYPTWHVEQQCCVQVMRVAPAFPFILGDTFLRGVMATFDAKHMRIGLARRPSAATQLEELADEFSIPIWVMMVAALIGVAGMLSMFTSGKYLWRRFTIDGYGASDGTYVRAP